MYITKEQNYSITCKGFSRSPNANFFFFFFFATQTLTSAACQMHFPELPSHVNHSESLIRALPRRLWHAREWCFHTAPLPLSQIKKHVSRRGQKSHLVLLGEIFLKWGLGRWSVLWECWVVGSRAAETCCAWQNGFQNPTPANNS